MANSTPDNPVFPAGAKALSGRSNLKAILLVVISFSIFSGCDVAVKLLAQSLPVPQVTFMVTAVALALSMLHGLVSGGIRDIVPRYPALAITRAVLLSVDTLLIYYAFSRLPLSEAYLLAFLTPVLVAILAFLLIGERLSGAGWAGVLLGFAGVGVALQPGVHPLNLGHLAAIGAALCFALSLVLLRRTKAAESDAALLVSLMVVLMLMALVMTLAGGGFEELESHEWAVVLAGGTMMYAGHTLLVKAFRAGDASVVAPFQYSQIIWGCLYGLLIFDTPIAPLTIAGAVLITISGLLVLK